MWYTEPGVSNGVIADGGVSIMAQDLWVKEVENPISRPLNDWRDELYGYWMVVSDSKVINGVETVIARYYGTDKEQLNKRQDDLRLSSNDITVELLLNKRSNWMGGAFIAKTGG